MEVEDAYAVIERIIVNGFLTAEMRVQGSYIVLKNLTDREAGILDLFRDPADAVADMACKLSFCTFSVDGENYSVSRAECIPILIDFWKSVPISVTAPAAEAIYGINERYYEAIRFLEGFCYTDKSRYLWKVYKEGGLFPVPGSLVTGMNSVQENWAIINRDLDSEEEYDRQFNLSVMVSSSMNPKGAKVVSRNYETRHNEIIELRKEIAKWGYDKKRVEEEKKRSEWTAPLRSREDLVRELYRQMRGEKDKHDLFMDKWREQQKERAEKAKRDALERSRQWRERMQSQAVVPEMPFEDSRPATADEIKALMDAPVSYTAKYMSAFEHLDKDERFLRKIGVRVIGE